MGIVVGLLAAAFFGSGDFLGGRASRDAPAAMVLFVAQVSAALGAVLLALAFTGSPIGADLAWGAAAGFVNAFALGLLYHGLATGRMGIVAPIAAMMGALIPVAWGLLSGEEPGPVVIVGVAIAVIAAGLISREPGDHGGAAGDPLDRHRAARGHRARHVAGALRPDRIGLRAVAGARRRGSWRPRLRASRSLIVIRSESVRLPSEPRRLAIGAGIADVAATAFLVYGIRHDLAVVVAPLAALGPGFTVMLAWAVLREPVSRHQVFGLVLALVGLALITAG